MIPVTERQQTSRRALLRRWWVLALPLAAWLLSEFAARNPMLTEQFYSSSIYLVLAYVLGAITSLLPFSLMELGICTAIIVIPILLVQILRKKICIPWQKLLFWAIHAGCILTLVFVLICGLNYHRPEFATFSGLEVQESSTEELEALCMELAKQANFWRAKLGPMEQVTQLPFSDRSLMVLAKQCFGELSEDYTVLPKLPITPKPVLNSWWMSVIQITGIFSPWTYEANVNIAAPDYSIPATACHELAHTRGFMREDEANFIAYLACQKSKSNLFQYSGVMLALVHANNRLYDADYDAFLRVYEQMCEGVRLDFSDNNAYWAQFEGPIAEVSDAVNDTYLKVNHQNDGVQSYGRMVDLLLADYRQKNRLQSV
ncbi:MAG: DUF3810 domain-containing protein [Anaerotruncus sp.]|nr:DUF3810 domain-containing protein [Anaerotruncus sp.]